MNLNLVFNSAIATTALTLLANLSATPPAKAYDVVLCEAASDLSFVDEYRQLGYYSAGEQFACTTPDGNTLVGQKYDRLVVIMEGAVFMNGVPFVFQAGEGILVNGGDTPENSETTSHQDLTDYVDSATYDFGYRVNYGDGYGGPIETYTPQSPY